MNRMSLAFFTFKEIKNMFKKLILYHCFELFEKAYHRHIEYQTIETYSVETQLKFVYLHKWWKQRRKKETDKDDQRALFQLISLWEYI